MKRSWAAIVLAIVMALIGFTLAVGGGWLLSFSDFEVHLVTITRAEVVCEAS